ncbi:hypothetical protein THAOC_00610, partial [Thalassiosira oceanica]
KMMIRTSVIAQGAFTLTDLGRDHERKRQSAPPPNSEDPNTKKRKNKSQAGSSASALDAKRRAARVSSSPVASAINPKTKKARERVINEVAREFMSIKVTVGVLHREGILFGDEVGQEEDGQFGGQGDKVADGNVPAER